MEAPSLTAEQRTLLLEEARAELARQSLLDYCERMIPSFESPPHIRLIIQHLEALERGDIKKLLVIMPPRSGKSFLTRAFVGWYWGRSPRAQIVLSSYGIELPTLASRDVRQQLRDPQYPFALRPARDSQSVERLHNDKGGVIVAAGTGGALTGFGGDLLVLDDPVKDAEAAASDVQMEKLAEWYAQTYSTRKMSGGKELLIGTVWSSRDLISRIVDSEDADAWTILRLPAIAEENDPIGRNPGEALWPEKYPIEYLREMETKLGTRAFSSLYQGLPLGSEDSKFKMEWFNRYTSVPQGLGIGIFVDAATGKTAHGDYTAIIVAGLAPSGHVYILDCIQERLQFHELQGVIQRLLEQHRGARCFVEDASAGVQLCQAIRAWGIPVMPLKPFANKEFRADCAVPFVEQRRVMLPERATWFPAFYREVLNDTPRHDDIRDAFVYMCLTMGNYVRQQQHTGTIARMTAPMAP